MITIIPNQEEIINAKGKENIIRQFKGLSKKFSILNFPLSKFQAMKDRMKKGVYLKLKWSRDAWEITKTIRVPPSEIDRPRSSELFVRPCHCRLDKLKRGFLKAFLRADVEALAK